jgi:hypothetical protein
VTPREAGELELEEPNWRDRFESHCERWPRLPRYLQEDSAFEATLLDWRRFHWTPIEVEGKLKKRPAGATQAIVALAKLRIFPPRNLIKDVPRDGKCYEPDLGDDHLWLQIAGRAWRIVAIEDKMLILDSFGEDKQIDLNRARWKENTDAALAAMGVGPL